MFFLLPFSFGTSKLEGMFQLLFPSTKIPIHSQPHMMVNYKKTLLWKKRIRASHAWKSKNHSTIIEWKKSKLLDLLCNYDNVSCIKSFFVLGKLRWWGGFVFFLEAKAFEEIEYNKNYNSCHNNYNNNNDCSNHTTTGWWASCSYKVVSCIFWENCVFC